MRILKVLMILKKIKGGAMLKIVHRVNTIKGLLKVPTQFGVEIDIRGWQDRPVLNHELFQPGDDLEEYLKNYKHAFIVFNIKETGIEQRVMDLAAQFGIEDYFLLDVEFPFLYYATKRGVRKIAVRYSEAECIDTTLLFKNKVDWVWIDVNTKLPLDKKVVKQLRGIKTCLVSPDRWGRPEDIEPYKQQMKALNFEPDAVMAGQNVIDLW